MIMFWGLETVRYDQSLDMAANLAYYVYIQVLVVPWYNACVHTQTLSDIKE